MLSQSTLKYDDVMLLFEKKGINQNQHSADAEVSSRSKYSGYPDIPAAAHNDFSWPYYIDANGNTDDSKPLSFFCQIEMSDLAEFDLGERFPKSGIFYFFNMPLIDLMQNREYAAGNIHRTFYSDNTDDLKEFIPPEGTRPGVPFTDVFVAYPLSFSQPEKISPENPLLSLFGKIKSLSKLTDKPTEKAEQPASKETEIDFEKLTNGLRKNAIGFKVGTHSDSEELPICSSKFGGSPDMKKDFIWPEFTYTENGKEETRPLAFLLQINLADTAKFDTEKRLPECGMLYFFYESLMQKWGDEPEDIGSFKVIYDENPEKSVRITPPEMLFSDDNVYSSKCVYPECPLEFFSYSDIPDAFSEIMSEKYDRDGRSEYGDFRDEYRDNLNAGTFKLLGYGDFIQDDFCYDCEKIAGNKNAEKTDTEYKKWQLLLQLESMETPDFPMWGDGGRLYFAIKEDDLKNRDFDKCHMVLQCY
ncbi:MAG: DUF1963 domain-containing protein [Ruminococcus sp.]|jgi:uncharacterized protein YwqG|nr:DUF1963 domain-containing protein [Ruminococcus sp.]